MQVFRQFEQYMTDKEFSPYTIRNYLGSLRQFTDWFKQTNSAAFSFEVITRADIIEYKRFLQVDQQRSANTVNVSLSAITALMEWAKSTGQLRDNPCDSVRTLPVERGDGDVLWLTIQQQFALQRAIENDLRLAKLRYPKRWVTRRRDASLVGFLLHTGLHLGELVAMRLEDVHLSEGKGSLVVRSGWGAKQRTVLLDMVACQVFRDWMGVRPATDSDFVWVGVEGEPKGLSERAVQRALGRYAEEAGLDELTPRILRHTFAKNLIDQEVGLVEVAALLGVKSLNSLRVYFSVPGPEAE